ncbi:MAG TPA: ROK family protein [Anaerolineales bacterium]|nr:ROK family protein [Anaerolineales bacterium]
MSSPEKFAIGIDIGATKIASALVSESGRMMHSMQVPTNASEGKDAVMDRVADQVRELMRRSPGEVVGAGVGSPGKVNSTRGIVHDAVNLGWAKLDLLGEISNRMGASLPLWIQKDTNLSALGEYYFGACRDCDDFVYVGVGSGLGGGIVSGGRLITGGGWYAAELGHLSIDPDGPLCACGGRGCAETVASGPGLVRVTKIKLAEFPGKSILRNDADLTSAGVISAAQKGDGIAQAALREVGRALGIVMSACAAILNPSRFVIGGGLGLAGFDFVLPAVLEEMKRRTIPNSRGAMEVIPSRVESPAIGAACLVWYALSGKMPGHDKGGGAETNFH